MAANMGVRDSRLWRGMRWVVWGGAVLLLSLPLIAMQFTAEVNWTLFDFVVMGIMLGLVCGAFELAVRVARNNVYVVAAGVAVATAFLTTWINLAVGIIGNENNPANLMFFGVLAIGFVSVLFARLEPLGMARAMEVTAVAQAIVGVIAFLTTSGQPEAYALPGFFVAMWLISVQLFRKAARQQADAGRRLKTSQ